LKLPGIHVGPVAKSSQPTITKKGKQRVQLLLLKGKQRE